MTIRLAGLLLFSLLAGGCSCLSIYQDAPVGFRANVDGVSNIDVSPGGGLGSSDLRSVSNIVTSSFDIWVNYESVAPIVGQVVLLSVNGKVVREIRYEQDSGFKTTGKFEIAPYLVKGENKVKFQAIVGTSPDKKSVQRASRMARADGFLALDHRCYETPAPFEMVSEEYTMTYSPK